MPKGFVPRDWQDRFVRDYQTNPKKNFLQEACTSAGKTAGALYAYVSLKDGLDWRFLVVVVHCNQKNIPLAWQSRPGYCSRCLKWLGFPLDTRLSNSKPLAEEELKWEAWVASSTGSLVAAAPYLMSPPLKDTIGHALCAYAQQATQGNIAAFARQLRIPKNTMWLWCKGRNLPTLDALLRICYCLGVSVLDFVTQGFADQCLSTKLPPQLQVNKRASSKPFNVDRVRQYLEAVLESNLNPPPSMEEVARRLECNRRTIYKYFRDLCRAISAQYLSYQKVYYQGTIEQYCLEVRQTAFKLHNEGKYPTEALVSQLISKPGYFRSKKVRAALREARHELGLEP